MKQQGHTLSRRQALAASVAAVGSTAVAVAVPSFAHAADPFAALLAEYIKAEAAFDAACVADDAVDASYWKAIHQIGPWPRAIYNGHTFSTVEAIEEAKGLMMYWVPGNNGLEKVMDTEAVARATATQEKMREWDRRAEEIKIATGKARTEAEVFSAGEAVSAIKERIQAIQPTTALGSYARLRAEWFDVRYRADHEPEMFAAFRAAMSGLEAALGLPPAPGNPHTAEA